MSDYQNAKRTQQAYLKMAAIAEMDESGVIWDGKAYITASQCNERANKWGKIVKKHERYEREKSEI